MKKTQTTEMSFQFNVFVPRYRRLQPWRFVIESNQWTVTMDSNPTKITFNLDDEDVDLDPLKSRAASNDLSLPADLHHFLLDIHKAYHAERSEQEIKSALEQLCLWLSEINDSRVRILTSDLWDK